MIRPQHIMFLAFCLFGGNLICAIVDGVWLNAEDANLLTYLTGMTNLQTASWTAVFTVPFNFLTHGLPKLIFWDFSFFAGSWAIVQYFLIAISVGTIFGLYLTFAGSSQGIFTRR